MVIRREHFEFGGSKSRGQSTFILLKSSRLSNPSKLAKAIALYKGVKEVLITSGDYGFIVLTDSGPKNSSSRIQNLIARRIGLLNIKSATKHLSYRKV